MAYSEVSKLPEGHNFCKKEYINVKKPHKSYCDHTKYSQNYIYHVFYLNAEDSYPTFQPQFPKSEKNIKEIN